jgi:hypothetical protein
MPEKFIGPINQMDFHDVIPSADSNSLERRSERSVLSFNTSAFIRLIRRLAPNPEFDERFGLLATVEFRPSEVANYWPMSRHRTKLNS